MLTQKNQNLASENSLEFDSNSHALIGISTFNSYFSVERMENLFAWAEKNFDNFDIFLMDEASVFNLLALGYSEKKALEKTRKHDRNLKNRILRSLINRKLDLAEAEKKIISLSSISKNDRYQKIYESYIKFFEENDSFRSDCLGATRAMLKEKTEEITEEGVHLATKYLLAELPLWLQTPYILNIPSSSVVYKNLSIYLEKICYNYNLLAPNQKIFILNV